LLERERACRQVEREEEEDEAVGWETDGEACGGGATRAYERGGEARRGRG